jgi:hypothetical protein
MSGRLGRRGLEELAGSLSDTDRAVLDSLARVRVATGRQLERLHFAGRPSSARQARRHLARLAERRLVCRLDQRIGGVRGGSSGFVYTLDAIGQRLLAASLPRQPRRPWTPSRAFTAHALAVTDLYVGLTEAERQGQADLVAFTAEPACWRSSVDGPLKPDAFIRTAAGQWEHAWFVELDLGTEAPVTLSRKCEAYRRYWQSGTEQERHGVFPRVLFVVPDEDRKTVLVDVLVRQPAEAWTLFQVVLQDAAVRVLCGGRP